MLPHEKEHEREAFRNMTFRQKVQHIRIYYGLFIVIILFSAAVGGSMIWNMFFKPHDRYMLQVAVFDELFDPVRKEEMTAELRDYFGLTDPHDIVMISDGFSSSSVQDLLKLSVLAAASEIDMIVGDRAVFEKFAGEGYFTDLDEIQIDESWAGEEELFVSAPGLLETESMSLDAEPAGKGDVCRYGISLAGSGKWQSLGGTAEDPVAGLVVSGNNEDNALRFITYLEGGV